MDILDRLVKKLRYYPAHGLFIQGLGYLGITIRPFRVLACRITEDALTPKSGAVHAGCRIQFLSHAGAAALEDLGTGPGWMKTVRERFERGDRCAVARRNHEIVAVLWSDLKRCRFPGCPFVLGADEVALYDGYVRPDCRGKGLMAAMVRETCRVLGREGRHAFYMIVVPYNRPSLRFAAKLEVRCVESGVVLGLFEKSSPLRPFTPARQERMRSMVFEDGAREAG